MSYNWTAIYNDNTELNQYKKDGSEVLFKEIEQDKLIAFRIDNEQGRHVIVDLKIGMFVVNGNIFAIPNLSNKEEKYRLIYFRRVTQNIGTSGSGKSKLVRPHIGFQVTIDNKNYKAIISEDKGIYNILIQ
jgi:hypothetical protein